MIDWARVRELQSEVGAEDFDEVVDLFLTEVDEVVARLGQQVDLSTLEPDMHFLKGSALNLGFSDLSSLCAQGEKLASDGQAAQVNVAHVLGVYAQSRQSFLADLPNQL